MDISKRVYQRLRLIGYGTVPDFFCYSAEYRQQINRRTNPCPTPSHLPPLSKVRCCRPKKFERLPEGLLAPLRFAPHSYRPLSKVRCCRPKKFGRLPEELPHQPSPRTNPSKNRTIPLAFRRGASLLLPLHRILPFPQQLQKDNNPSKIAITLASLVKGRWIDGKAQTVALLRFNCISTPFLSPNLFAVKTEGLLHPLAPHQPSQNRTIPFAFRVASSTAPLPTK